MASAITILLDEWLCPVKELAEWFKMCFQHQALVAIDDLQKEKRSHKCIFIDIAGIYNKRKHTFAQMFLSGGE